MTLNAISVINRTYNYTSLLSTITTKESTISRTIDIFSELIKNYSFHSSIKIGRAHV